MTRPSSTQLLIGALFVAVGIVLLLRSLHVWIYNGPAVWAVVLTVGGLVLAGTGIASERTGRVFLGSWAFLYGLFLDLRLFNVVEPFPHLTAFAVLMSLALSLLMLFLYEPHNFGNLVGALCVGALSMWVYFSSTNEMWADNIRDFFRLYWPIALILVGLNALLRGVRRSRAG